MSSTLQGPETLDVQDFHEWQRNQLAMEKLVEGGQLERRLFGRLAEAFKKDGYGLDEMMTYFKLVGNGSPLDWAEQYIQTHYRADYLAVDALWEQAILYDVQHTALKRIVNWSRPYLEDKLVNRHMPTAGTSVLNEGLLQQCALETLQSRSHSYVTEVIEQGAVMYPNGTGRVTRDVVEGTISRYLTRNPDLLHKIHFGMGN